MGVINKKASLLSRMSPEKNFQDHNSQTFAKTRASTIGTHTQQAGSQMLSGTKPSFFLSTQLASTKNSEGASSPFREATMKGVMSGTGMLMR